jgi:hypothetical protein
MPWRFTAGLLPVPHAVCRIARAALWTTLWTTLWPGRSLMLSLPPGLGCKGLDGRLLASRMVAPTPILPGTVLSRLTLAPLTATSALGAWLVAPPTVRAAPILPRLILSRLIWPGLFRPLLLLLAFASRCANCLCRLIATARTAAEAWTPWGIVRPG